MSRGNVIPIQTSVVPRSGQAVPGESTAAIQATFDFTSVASIVRSLDLSSHGFSSVQGMFIDNAANNSSVSFLIGGTNENCTVAANSQAFFRVIQIGQIFNITGSSAGTVPVKVLYLNFPVETMIWAVTPPGTPSGVITITGNVTTTPSTATTTDKSGAVAAGPTSTQVMAANGGRKGFLIYNPATAAGQGGGIVAPEILYVNIGAAAGVDNGTSYEVLPGGYFPPGGVIVEPTAAINAISATAGHQFIAKEFT